MILRFFKRRNKDVVVESPPVPEVESPIPVPEPPVKKAPRKSSKKPKE